MRVALVHDYLTEYGGAERVLEAIHELWPKAPVFTSIFNVETGHAPSLPSRVVQASRLQKIPLVSKLAKSFTFFMPLIFETLISENMTLSYPTGRFGQRGF